jgi:hypothetical protein
LTFAPTSGVLAVGALEIIRVVLVSDVLGPFSEVFEWALEGTAEPVRVELRGRVVGPSFAVRPVFCAGAGTGGRERVGMAERREREIQREREKGERERQIERKRESGGDTHTERERECVCVCVHNCLPLPVYGGITV